MTTTYEDEFDHSRNLTATAAAEYKDLVKDYVSAMMNIFDDDGGLDKSNLSAAKKIASGYYRSYRLSQAAKFAAWAEALVTVVVQIVVRTGHTSLGLQESRCFRSSEKLNRQSGLEAFADH